MDNNSIIPELASAAYLPGYTGCVESCGGLACGCLLPLPACSFYKVAHLPQSSNVYEAFDCLEWKPIVRLMIRSSLFSKNVEKDLVLTPYVAERVDDMSITVTSLARLQVPLLDTRFITSHNETLALPYHYKLPVECPTVSMALNHFEKCHSKVICDCDAAKSPVQCHCPPETIYNLRSSISNVLPITAANVIIGNSNGLVAATLAAAEVTVSMEASALRNSAEYVLQQDCKIDFSSLHGCYDCQEGAIVSVRCYTKEPTWVVIQCDDNIFSTECGPTAKETNNILAFQRAIINQKCYAQCNNKPVQIDLNGTLAFLPNASDEDIFNSQGASLQSDSTWFSDLKIPDFSPILSAIGNHWKLSVGIFGITTLLLLLTYLAGPAVIILMLKILTTCVESMLKVIASAVSLAVGTLKKRLQA
ncbi:hypothetical protein OSTOST_02344 [Ostertagia ostertagi]